MKELEDVEKAAQPEKVSNMLKKVKGQ